MVVSNLLFSVSSIYQPLYKQSEGLTNANEMADFIIAATAEEAKERGFTAGYVSAKEKGISPDSSIRSKIDDFRQKGDKNVQSAFILAEELEAINWGGSEFKAALLHSKITGKNYRI